LAALNAAPREAAIREALRARLAATGVNLVDELGIKHGKYRVDVCAITHELHGYEIKSDVDTLARLPDQAKHFSLVFHRMTLVIGPKLLGQSLAMLPPWWGIWLVTPDGFAALREGAPNPKPNYRWVVRLLWRDELHACLRAVGAKGYSKLTYAGVATMMLKTFSPEELTALVVGTLRNRKGEEQTDWSATDNSSWD
jgi:hypothetical protein